MAFSTIYFPKFYKFENETLLYFRFSIDSILRMTDILLPEKELTDIYLIEIYAPYQKKYHPI